MRCGPIVGPINGSTDARSCSLARTSPTTAGGRRDIRPSTSSWRALPNVNPRDGASDDEPLDLRSPFEDRVDIGGNVHYRWSEASLPNNHPTNCGSYPMSPHQRPITPHVVGEVRVSPRNFGLRRNAKSIHASPPKPRTTSVNSRRARCNTS